jgi:hypothetical protein
MILHLITHLGVTSSHTSSTKLQNNFKPKIQKDMAIYENSKVISNIIRQKSKTLI